MAKTSTERMREKKARDKKEQLVAQDNSYPYLKKTFSELSEESAGFSDFEMVLELAGIEPPRFEDERNPEEYTVNADAIGLELYGVENFYDNKKGAIGRAEVIIGSLIDAAAELARIVHNYKQQEIKNHLIDLECSGAADRATAMNEAVRLNKMLDQLNKQVRRTFPQWEIKGD